MNKSLMLPALPWWRVPIVWLVIAGPAVVVVAGTITFAIAWRGGDVPLLKAPQPRAEAMSPATQARNHVVAPRAPR
ncbi:nitrogen fixation protein FixH [Aquabacterium sp.]|uniref:nitrogen fixation protein FixH n=1 Tax=Aquabacterium sp. TaxID=1872578 RepID=UPI002B54A0F8|nr:nitrogen fixation protein FixH [Aquabacterium sp.]HSW05919.1 nitrogen fixation protein FixH [Aquabacterium sp.]